MTKIYSVDNYESIGCDARTSFCPEYGFHNMTQLKDQLVMVNTYDDFVHKIKDYQDFNSDYYSSMTFGSNPNSNSNTEFEDNQVSGGLWMGEDRPIFATEVQSI